MNGFRFTHTDTVDDVHTYNVVADTLTAAKRDVAAKLGATYGAVRLVGNRGEYVVTATHGRQTLGTVTVERVEESALTLWVPDEAPAGPICGACNGDAMCVAHDAHHGVVSFATPAPTFPWPTAPMGGDYTGGRPLPELGDVVMTHRWRGGVRDVDASPATVVAPNTEDSRIVRFADGKEQAAFGYDMEPTGARVVEANGRTFDVVPCGRREWTVTERGGNGASGLITDQGPRFEYAVDLSGVEGWANNGLASAVREFAAETRMVHATRAQRDVAADYASPGAIGRVLAELATTGTARLDLLSDDVRRTIGSLAMPERPAAAIELHAILTDVR